MLSSKASLICRPSETDRVDNGSFPAADVCGGLNTTAGFDSEMKLTIGVKAKLHLLVDGRSAETSALVLGTGRAMVAELGVKPEPTPTGDDQAKLSELDDEGQERQVEDEGFLAGRPPLLPRTWWQGFTILFPHSLTAGVPAGCFSLLG